MPAFSAVCQLSPSNKDAHRRRRVSCARAARGGNLHARPPTLAVRRKLNFGRRVLHRSWMQRALNVVNGCECSWVTRARCQRNDHSNCWSTCCSSWHSLHPPPPLPAPPPSWPPFSQPPSSLPPFSLPLPSLCQNYKSTKSDSRGRPGCDEGCPLVENVLTASRSESQRRLNGQSIEVPIGFVHITKAGGTSVEFELDCPDLRCSGHSVDSWMWERLGMDSLVVIRDPIDRFVSNFNYAKFGSDIHHGKELALRGKHTSEFVYFPSAGAFIDALAGPDRGVNTSAETKLAWDATKREGGLPFRRQSQWV